MSLLKAFDVSKQSFLRATTRMASRADRLSRVSHDEKAFKKIAEDLIGLNQDKLQVQSGFRVIRVATDLFLSLTKIGKN